VQEIEEVMEFAVPGALGSRPVLGRALGTGLADDLDDRGGIYARTIAAVKLAISSVRCRIRSPRRDDRPVPRRPAPPLLQRARDAV